MIIDDVWCSLCGSVFCTGECVEEPCEEPHEEIGPITHKCTEKDLSLQVSALKYELDKTRYLLEQAKCNNAHLENELQGIRQQLCLMLGSPVYDTHLVVLRSRDGLCTVMALPHQYCTSIRTAIKPALRCTFKATPDNELPDIRYREYERTSLTWAKLPVYEEVGE